mmetsp:Transcript_31486/g.50835  ORF Transcript_31486/g.50835 Transcript_31486/m.50835 type:complete len:93 (+) Transcript_31486:85-363(+)
MQRPIRGALESKTGSLDGQEIGILNLLKKPTLMIGNNKLEGTCAEVKKPLVILRKIKDNSDSVSEDQPCHYEVAGVIRERILFKSRPRPIVL